MEWKNAKYWIPVEDKNIPSNLTNVAIGKRYEIKKGKREDYIVDDEGDISLIFLYHKGELIQIRGDNMNKHDIDKVDKIDSISELKKIIQKDMV